MRGNACVGPNLYLMTLDAPDIAASIEPGQFVHMLVPGMEAHILRRPFSVYARDAHAGTLEILYQAVGFGSAHMTGLAADGPLAGDVELVGPVGRTWQPAPDARRALLVGGGVCYTIGCIFYVLKKIPYMHSIFHLWVLAGTVCQFLAIAFYIM